MKTIIFTVTNDLNFDQRMHRICSALQKAGCNVTLVGRERKSSMPLAPQTFQQIRIRCFFEAGKLFYFEYNLRLLFWLLFSRSADCYSAVDLDTILPCLLAAKLKGKKLVYDAHEYFTEVPEVINRAMVKKTWQFVEKISISKINRGYTVSAGIANLFKQKYKIHFDVIRNMPEKNISAAGSPDEDYILYQGALNAGRAIEHYIRAMRYVNCKLYLAGEGDLSEPLRNLVKQENLESKVKFLGFVAPNDLKQTTAGATIGLNCLEDSGLSYRYSLSNRTFDYIMAGIPQIISDFPEYVQLNREYEIATVAKDLSPAALADTINTLLSDKQLYGRLKNNCIKAREILNWENEEKKLLAIYET